MINHQKKKKKKKKKIQTKTERCPSCGSFGYIISFWGCFISLAGIFSNFIWDKTGEGEGSVFNSDTLPYNSG